MKNNSDITQIIRILFSKCYGSALDHIPARINIIY
jgi:hypothetical protein